MATFSRSVPMTKGLGIARAAQTRNLDWDTRAVGSLTAVETPRIAGNGPTRTPWTALGSFVLAVSGTIRGAEKAPSGQIAFHLSL
jgi:hypothetical protein